MKVLILVRITGTCCEQSDASLVAMCSKTRKELHNTESDLQRLFVIDKDVEERIQPKLTEGWLPTAWCWWSSLGLDTGWWCLMNSVNKAEHLLYDMQKPSPGFLEKFDYIIKASDNIIYLTRDWDRLLINGINSLSSDQHPMLGATQLRANGMAVADHQSLVIYRTKYLLDCFELLTVPAHYHPEVFCRWISEDNPQGRVLDMGA